MRFADAILLFDELAPDVSSRLDHLIQRYALSPEQLTNAIEGLQCNQLLWRDEDALSLIERV
jgi:hypothetical protein